MTGKTVKAFAPWLGGVMMAVMQFVIGVTSDLEPSLLLVTLSVVNGLLIAGIILFTRWLANRFYKETVIERDKDEELILEGAANHVFGRHFWSISGGRLVLTTRRLVFKAHKHNSRVYQESFDMSGLKKAASTKALKFLTNGLKLEMKDNSTLKFNVEEPDKWVEKLNGLAGH